MVVFGGNKAWRVYRFRDLGVAFHWLNDEPCLCLFPTSSIGKAGAYALPLSSLHRITVESDTVDGVAVMECGIRAADAMGRAGDAHFARNCSDAILHYAGELLRMPPAPDWMIREEAERARRAAGVVGEIEVKADGKTIYEGEA